MKVYHIGVSLIDTPKRVKGKCYKITTNLRSKRIKFIGDDDQVYSSEKRKGWKFLDKKYINKIK